MFPGSFHGAHTICRGLESFSLREIVVPFLAPHFSFGSRMLKNPLHYGFKWEELARDPRLESHRRKLITNAARELEACRMARFDEKSGNLYVTELGRVASHFYINHKTVVTFNELLRRHMTEKDVFDLISRCWRGTKEEKGQATSAPSCFTCIFTAGALRKSRPLLCCSEPGSRVPLLLRSL